MEKILELLINRKSSRKIRISSRKIRKILRRVWTTPKRIFETFCTQEAPRCIDMNATHNFLFDSCKDFSYTIFPIKKINVGKVLKV
jgi:hypothetical protein